MGIRFLKGYNMKWQEDLVKDIRSSTIWDYQDAAFQSSNHGGSPEFTICNRESLKNQFLKIKDKCKAILEIGVCRNELDSSTYVFLDNKNDDCTYIGIDLEDKSFLNNKDKKIFTIKHNSCDVAMNMDFIRGFGVTQFDFIFIDGYHSINQMYIDWEYTRWLSNHGIVGLHDINCHPGPHYFIENLNPYTWIINKDSCPNDWGIGFVSKKEPML